MVSIALGSQRFDSRLRRSCESCRGNRGISTPGRNCLANRTSARVLGNVSPPISPLTRLRCPASYNETCNERMQRTDDLLRNYGAHRRHVGGARGSRGESSLPPHFLQIFSRSLRVENASTTSHPFTGVQGGCIGLPKILAHGWGHGRDNRRCLDASPGHWDVG